MRASVTTSLALHAVAIIAVARSCSGRVAVQPAAVAEPAPIEISVWTEPPAPAVPAEPSAAVGAAPHGPASHGRPSVARAAIAARVSAATSPTPAPSSSTAGATRSLAMRAAADLQIHELHDAPHDAGPEPHAVPLATPAAPDTGEPDPHQTHEAFALTTEADGTAHLHDARNLRWALGVPTKADVRNRLEAWQDEVAHAYDSKDYCADPERPIEHPIGSIGATVLKFDVTDWMMRRHGDDPYASAKLAQLDATRAQRVQAGARYRREELGRAGALVQRNLETLWTTVADPAERKRALFALWDECSDSGADADVDAGARARARIVAFIREHLAAGTPNAFTSGELAALNRGKQSHEVFAPYTD